MTRDAEPATLDPDAAAVLATIEASGRPPLHLLEVSQMRAAVQASRDVFGLPAPPVRMRDLSLAGPGGPIGVRNYRPLSAGDEVALPAMLYFHGGGWVVGDLEYGDWFCASIAERLGIAVISVAYRLAPEHPFPAGLDDCLTVLDHVHDAAPSLGVNGARLVVCGDSAGANLAAVCALEARKRGIALCGQLLLYPVTDIAEEHDSYVRNGEGYGLSADTMRYFRAAYLNGADPADPMVSPLRTAGLAGAPPATVLTCGFDPLCDEGDAYAARLAAAGVPVHHIRYPGQIHGFLMWPKVIGAAELALDQVAQSVGTMLACPGA